MGPGSGVDPSPQGQHVHRRNHTEKDREAPMLANTHPAPGGPPPVTRTVAPGSVGLVQRQIAHFDSPLPERRDVGYAGLKRTGRSTPTGRDDPGLPCAFRRCPRSRLPHRQLWRRGWWDDAVSPGKIFDTNRFFVLCSNVIGGCQAHGPVLARARRQSPTPCASRWSRWRT